MVTRRRLGLWSFLIVYADEKRRRVVLSEGTKACVVELSWRLSSRSASRVAILANVFVTWQDAFCQYGLEKRATSIHKSIQGQFHGVNVCFSGSSSWCNSCSLHFHSSVLSSTEQTNINSKTVIFWGSRGREDTFWIPRSQAYNAVRKQIAVIELPATHLVRYAVKKQTHNQVDSGYGASRE